MGNMKGTNSVGEGRAHGTKSSCSKNSSNITQNFKSTANFIASNVCILNRNIRNFTGILNSDPLLYSERFIHKMC